MQHSSCDCTKEVPPPQPKELTQLEEIFFGKPDDQDIPINTLTDQILMLNMLTVDLRLLMRLVQLRTDVASQQPMYWAQPMLTQMMHLRLVDIRKLTEQHTPNKPEYHTICFNHLIHELKLRKLDSEKRALLNRIKKHVNTVGTENAHVVNKYIVHAATAASRETTHPAQAITSVAIIWQRVLVLNHVFHALYRHVQSDSDTMAYPRTLRNHLHDMQRYFLLSEPELVHLRAILTTSMADLDAIQSRTAVVPWAVRTAQ